MVEKTGVANVIRLAEKKVQYFKKNPLKMFLYSMMSGQFFVLSTVASYMIATYLSMSKYTYDLSKLSIGFTCGLGLTLVVYCGAELFTGDAMVVSMGVMDKKVGLWDSIKLLTVVYVGNYAGAVMFAGIVHMAGIMENDVFLNMINTSVQTKMALPMFQSFWRAVLCNTVVSLSIWAVAKHESKIVGIILVNWSVLGFVVSGYEHVVANFSVFMLALMQSQGVEGISWLGFFRNVVPVTFGNVVGAALFVSLQYYLVGNGKEQK